MLLIYFNADAVADTDADSRGKKAWSEPQILIMMLMLMQMLFW